MGTESLAKLPTHEKVMYFRAMIEKNTLPVSQGIILVKVSRESILQDSLVQFKKITDLRKVLNIAFENEVSQDRGGLSREFFAQLLKEVFSDGLMLFTSASTENFTYKVHEESWELQRYRELFYFTG